MAALKENETIRFRRRPSGLLNQNGEFVRPMTE
jgi:hypothetical protein